MSKPPKIELVEQKHTYGCGVACIAMVTGRDYDDVARDIDIDFDRRGMPWEMYYEYLSDAGYSLIAKVMRCWKNVDWTKDEMLKPFAPVHIVSVEQFAGAKMSHALVMTHEGKLICPSGTDEEEVRKGIYKVGAIWGVYPA